MRRYWLIIILVLAAFLRLYGLDRGDTMNDEVFYAFRGLGWIDYDKAPLQTTPLEWWDSRATNGGASIPWWTSLSFHDHPPLVFGVQNIFMKIFGDSTLAERLPSALLGIASVYLVYLIGAFIFSESAGLISAVFLAVTLNNIYISRVGLQESYVIFFMLLAGYLFLKSFKKDKYLIWTGLALGLGFLTKYNVFIMVPIFLTYLAIYKRAYFLSASWRKKLWLGTLLALFIFSPVIVYNAMLYRAVGHFDFQLSFIFHQNHPEWQIEPGKEIGSFGERLKNFIPRMAASNSWLFLILFAISLIFLRNPFLIINFLFLILLLLFIGPSYRFLTMLTPWMALSLGGRTAKWRFDRLWLFLPIFAFEIFYSYNNQIAYYPIGPQPWLSSKVRYENYNWGYNALEDYLEKEFQGKMPALAFVNRYQFLDDLQDKALEKARGAGLLPYPVLLAYYGNIDDGPRLWILERLRLYHGWPIITFDTFEQFLRDNGADYYKKLGFKNYYFIMQTNIVPTPEFRELVAGVKPEIIRNNRGDEAFKIYKFFKEKI